MLLAVLLALLGLGLGLGRAARLSAEAADLEFRHERERRELPARATAHLECHGVRYGAARRGCGKAASRPRRRDYYPALSRRQPRSSASC